MLVFLIIHLANIYCVSYVLGIVLGIGDIEVERHSLGIHGAYITSEKIKA